MVLQLRALVENLRYRRSVSGLSSPLDFNTVPLMYRLVAALRLVCALRYPGKRAHQRLTSDLGFRRSKLAIPSQAAIVVDRALRSSRGSSVASVTTTLTDQQPLQQGRFDGTSGRKPVIFLELLLRQSEGSFTDQSGYGNFDPLLTRPFPRKNCHGCTGHAGAGGV